MKQQAIQYLAMDVHQATVVASLRDESGKVLMRRQFPPRRRPFSHWSGAPARACMWPSRKGRRRNGCTTC